MLSFSELGFQSVDLLSMLLELLFLHLMKLLQELSLQGCRNSLFDLLRVRGSIGFKLADLPLVLFFKNLDLRFKLSLDLLLNCRDFIGQLLLVIGQFCLAPLFQLAD